MKGGIEYIITGVQQCVLCVFFGLGFAGMEEGRGDLEIGVYLVGLGGGI